MLKKHHKQRWWLILSAVYQQLQYAIVGHHCDVEPSHYCIHLNLLNILTKIKLSIKNKNLSTSYNKQWNTKRIYKLVDDLILMPEKLPCRL